MNADALSVYPETEIETLLPLMPEHELHGLPVVDRSEKVIGHNCLPVVDPEGKLLGMVTRVDVLEALTR